MRRARALALAALTLAVVAVATGSTHAGIRPAPPRSPESRVAGEPVTISAVGDTMLGDTPVLPAHPAHYLDLVKAPLANAQITFGNLEGTLTTATHSKCSGSSSPYCFAFRVPPRYAQYLRWDGFDVLNSANNHSHDFGTTGLRQTSAALAKYGIAQEGLPGQIAVLDAGGTKVAFVGFAPYPTTCNLLNLTTAASLIRKADAKADLVVVYMHAGAEGADKTHVTGREEYFIGEDRGNPRRFAHMAVDNGADLVLASGPHVLRGMEFYRHRLLVYSLGDFASYHNFGTDGIVALAGILHVAVGPHGWFRSGRLISTRLDSDGRPHPDSRRRGAHLVAQLSREDFGSHAARVLADGTIEPPA